MPTDDEKEMNMGKKYLEDEEEYEWDDGYEWDEKASEYDDSFDDVEDEPVSRKRLHPRAALLLQKKAAQKAVLPPERNPLLERNPLQERERSFPQRKRNAVA